MSAVCLHFGQIFVYILLSTVCLHRFEKLAIPIENGPDEQTGEEFSYQSSLPFTFKDEFQAIKTSKHTLLMKLPHLIPPRCTFKVTNSWFPSGSINLGA